MADKSIGTESFATEKKKAVKKRLRLAFIGCGGICQTHIAAIAKIPELEIVAGCDIDPERLEVMKSKHGIQKVYEKWDDMLKAVKPDVVDVCTPNGVHAPATIAALNAGCHVIVEKPMAMNPAECIAMIEAAKKNKKLLCAGFQQRYNPKSQFLKQLREAGDIGDIMFVKCQALRRRGVPNWGVFGQKDLQGGGAENVCMYERDRYTDALGITGSYAQGIGRYIAGGDLSMGHRNGKRAGNKDGSSNAPS